MSDQARGVTVTRWDSMASPHVEVDNQQSDACVDVALADGRQIQVVLRKNGGFLVRAWIAPPAEIGHRESFSAKGFLPTPAEVVGGSHTSAEMHVENERVALEASERNHRVAPSA